MLYRYGIVGKQKSALGKHSIFMKFGMYEEKYMRMMKLEAY